MSTSSPQQAPSSQLHPALLFSSSQAASVAHSGAPHPSVVGLEVDKVVGAVVGGDGFGGTGPKHSQSVQKVLSTSSPQQAPSSQLHPALLFSLSQAASVAHSGAPHPPVVGVGVGVGVGVSS